MTKTERLMLCDMYKYINSVPNFRNNMDFEGYSMFRRDVIELQGYLGKLIYALLMYGSPEENKSYWKEEFDKYLEELKCFIETRQKEQWKQGTQYSYQFYIPGW